MRIAHVVETLERGGLERMVCDLALAQAGQGWPVTVHCLFHRGVLADELAAAGIVVNAIGKRSGTDLGALWRLRRSLLRCAPQVVHSHNAVAHYHCIAASRLSRIGPTVNTRHGMGDKPGSRVERRYRRSLVHTARVVAVSQYSAAHLVRQGIVTGKQMCVIRNGIRVDRFARPRAAARALLGMSDETLLVGTVGRLNWTKDQSVLIDAVATLAPRVPQLRCVLVGEGALRVELTQQVAALGLQQRVALLGDRGDVPDILPAFDVFALPSRTEGYSIALLEAAASGVPAVVTDVGGNREIVQPGRTGIVSGGDFAAALLELLADPVARQRMGSAARTWACEHASIDAMARQYADLYGSLG